VRALTAGSLDAAGVDGDLWGGTSSSIARRPHSGAPPNAEFHVESNVRDNCVVETESDDASIEHQSLERCFLRDATRNGLRVKPYAKCLGDLEDSSEAWIALGAECAVEALAAEAGVFGYL